VSLAKCVQAERSTQSFLHASASVVVLPYQSDTAPGVVDLEYPEVCRGFLFQILPFPTVYPEESNETPFSVVTPEPVGAFVLVFVFVFVEGSSGVPNKSSLKNQIPAPIEEENINATTSIIMSMIALFI
jgi:hypothetical protein